MKIIFLDIDGVLCTRRSHLSYGKEGGIWHEWDPIACNAVRRSCLKGCRIVVSSTWRFHEEDLWPMMESHGLKEFVYFPDWKTPDMGRLMLDATWDSKISKIRGNEIEDWLCRHPEVSSYKILDDIPDFLEHQTKFHIHTDSEEGMDSDNIKKLLNWAGVLKS